MMAAIYGGADIDTSSLVNDDELNRQYGNQESTEKPFSVNDDNSNRRIEEQHGGEERLDKKSEVQRRLRSSGHFYDSYESREPNQVHQQISRQQIKQSKQLPHWIWVTLTVILGIGRSKPVLSTFLYMLTLFAALLFSLLGIIFTVFDISSKNSKTTAHIGFISLLIGFSWICLGIYSFRLAGRLFGNHDFAASVRTHSRTFFKISAAAILIICGIGFTGLNLYNGFVMFAGDRCDNVGLYSYVCIALYASRGLFSIIGMLWNLMVGCMLLSVCRTHTIGIRRFARDLAEESLAFEDYWREKLRQSKSGEYNLETSSILNNSDWFVLQESPRRSVQGVTNNDSVSHQGSGYHGNRSGNPRDTESNVTQRGSAYGGSNVTQRDSGNDEVFTVLAEESPTDIPQNEAPQAVLRIKNSDSSDETLPDTAPVMTEDELLLCYWKISSRMRVTSMCLQRWLASWMAFVIMWCADYVIFWLSHSPNILGIMEFIAPMLMLLILCAAYAEVNGEGQTMIRCICPTKERYGLLSFLHRQPLQMQVFGLSISYKAILTVLLAFSVAFSSRLILDEVMKT